MQQMTYQDFVFLAAIFGLGVCAGLLWALTFRR